ncbi:MAG: hypothetical protein MUC49_06870 [Raineya sp.]|jgi:hypothetical protein|nr:hypothetical protein [Raineya sp.]
MEKFHFKSNAPYVSFQKRLFKYTNFLFVLTVLGIQIVVLLVIAFMSAPYLAILGLFLSIFIFINYYIFTKWVRFYLEEISIDIQTKICYVKYYDKDMPRKEQIPIKNLEIKLEAIYVKGGSKPKLCIYKDKQLLVSQLCGVGYWTKPICQKIAFSYKGYQ